MGRSRKVSDNLLNTEKSSNGSGFLNTIPICVPLKIDVKFGLDAAFLVTQKLCFNKEGQFGAGMRKLRMHQQTVAL